MDKEELGKANQMSAETSNLSIGGVSFEEEDDGPPMLSFHALAALQEFLAEQNGSAADPTVAAASAEPERVELVSEDWRLSQFWYEPETAKTISREVVSLCCGSADSRVVCIACPTVYAYLRQMDPNLSVQLLEYDKRFERYGSDFKFYDYNQPEELPLELKHGFNIVVADPPYLSPGLVIGSLTDNHPVQLNRMVWYCRPSWAHTDRYTNSKECLEKVSKAISFLAKPENSFLLLLTGQVQRERAAELLGVCPCIFRPQHSNKLGNEFRVFTSYDPGTRLGGWEQDK